MPCLLLVTINAYNINNVKWQYKTFTLFLFFWYVGAYLLIKQTPMSILSYTKK